MSMKRIIKERMIKMFITRLKLVNFIGIKHGLDRDEVEINFSKDPQE